MSNFTIEGGVRWEGRNLGDRFGNTRHQPEEELRPAHRLHLRSDQRRQEQDLRALRPLLRGHPDRHQHPRLRRRAGGASPTTSTRTRRTSRRSTAPRSKNSLLGSSTEPVDPNLKNQYIDEFLVGFEREVAPNLSVGIKYNHRKLADVIEDFLVPASRRLLHRQPRPGHARPEPRLLRRHLGAGAAGDAHQRCGDPQRDQALLEQLAADRQLRLVEAGRQLRRHQPDLDRPARPEHQLGVRLRRLPDQLERAAEQPAHSTRSRSTGATTSARAS